MSNAEEAEKGPEATEPAETVPAEKLPAETVPAETVPAEKLPAEKLSEETLDDASRARFLRDLVERGEVVPKGEDLPAGATHELETKDGQQILHRRRFSTY
jgi:hypothetical protein